MEANYKVGQFVIESRLGEGGMAEVWLARHAHLGTPAAIKFLSPQYAGRTEIEERFLNEGKRQGSLDHPNIVKVFGFEYVDGRSFLVLQYVEGESLEDRMQRQDRKPLPFSEIREISTAVLNGLEFAHSKNIVHRDVKPSNILIDKHGNAALGDFGIVLAVNERRMTRTGTVMGTPYYMSPEQIARPMELDHRADIYSFGCVLYEMFTGRTPFEDVGGEGDTDFNVKLAHTQQMAPPLRKFNAEVARPVEQVVMRCLEKNASDRFASCRELRDALMQAFAAPVDSSAFDYRKKTVPEPLPDLDRIEREKRERQQFDGGGKRDPLPPKKTWFEENKKLVAAVFGVVLIASAGVKFWPDSNDANKNLAVHHDKDNESTVIPPDGGEKKGNGEKNDNKGNNKDSKNNKEVVHKDDPSKTEDDPKKGAKKETAENKDDIPKPPDTDTDRKQLAGIFRVQLLSPISTSKSKEGDAIRARVVSPASFQGAVVEGIVNKSKRNGKFSKKAELLFAFHTVHLSRTQAVPINSQVISFKNSQGKAKVDEEGQIIESSNGLKKVALLGAAGAAIGAIWKGAKGAVVGGAAGAGSAIMLNTFASKGPDISFDTGSEFELKVSTRRE